MTPQEALLQTAAFTADVATKQGMGDNRDTAFLVAGGVLIAQQAATLALIEAGDIIPEQAGATELLLRAANAKHLSQPYTLAFSATDRKRFDRLVLKRNAFMHPRGQIWQIEDARLGEGLLTSCNLVQHLCLTQPIGGALLRPSAAQSLTQALDEIGLLAGFLADPLMPKPQG